MLILLPPSEGKTPARRGRPLDLGALGFPSLGAPRERVLDVLVGLCADDPETAMRTLGLGPAQADLVTRNARLRTAPTGRADHVYSGVLYDALGLPTLSGSARRRAATRLAVTSSLFGLVRPTDRIPAYRLSGDTTLPGLGPVAALWRLHLGEAVGEALGPGLLVDLRSTTYAAFWRPPPVLARRVVTVRVLHEAGGRRTVVSHFNKATKGRLVRDLLEDGARPGSPKGFARVLGDLGWRAEVGSPTASGTAVDVVVADV